MSALTFAVAPAPSVTIAITAATPITMPSMVSDERSTLRRICAQRHQDRVPDHQAASPSGCVRVDPAVEEADARAA